MLTVFHLGLGGWLIKLAHLLNARPASKFQIFVQWERSWLEEALSEAAVLWRRQGCILQILMQR